jgi:hypothetical protein
MASIRQDSQPKKTVVPFVPFVPFLPILQPAIAILIHCQAPYPLRLIYASGGADRSRPRIDGELSEIVTMSSF